MPILNSGKNLMLDSLGTAAGYASLHNADPGATGATGELTGGSPAYARKAITWSAAASGSKASSSQPVFDIPAGSTVAWVAFWSAVTGGTCYATSQLTSESFAAQGNYTLTSETVSLT